MGETLRTTTEPIGRQIVLHADDFGLNSAATEGIIRGFAHGVLTSTSVLANAPDAGRGLRRWNQLSSMVELPCAAVRRTLGDSLRPFDLGVHLNLTQGRPLTAGRYPPELLDAEGRFPGVRALFCRLRQQGTKFRAAIRHEVACQVQFVFDHGLRPTHLNGHQYVELIPAVAEIIPELCSDFGIRVVRVARERGLWRSTLLRGLAMRRWLLGEVKRFYARPFGVRMDAAGIVHPAAFFGTAHAGCVDLRLIRRFLGQRGLRGTVEVGLHPAEAPRPKSPQALADGWEDLLANSRPQELQLVLSPQLAEYLACGHWRLGRLSDLVAAGGQRAAA